MRAPLRMVLLAAVTAGAVLSGTAMAVAQDDDDTGLTGILKGVNCSTLQSELIGECNAEAPPPQTPPAGDSGGEDDSDTAAPTPGTGASDEGGEADESAAVTGSGDGADEDNGAAPVGGVETGAGGTADNHGAAAAVLVGSGLVTAGGAWFARRIPGQHARRSRQAL